LSKLQYLKFQASEYRYADLTLHGTFKEMRRDYFAAANAADGTGLKPLIIVLRLTFKYQKHGAITIQPLHNGLTIGVSLGQDLDRAWAAKLPTGDSCPPRITILRKDSMF
jgi:hypothetical protein